MLNIFILFHTFGTPHVPAIRTYLATETWTTIGIRTIITPITTIISIVIQITFQAQFRIIVTASKLFQGVKFFLCMLILCFDILVTLFNFLYFVLEQQQKRRCFGIGHYKVKIALFVDKAIEKIIALQTIPHHQATKGCLYIAYFTTGFFHALHILCRFPNLLQ